MPYNSGVADILGIVLYTLRVALVIVGVSLNRTPLDDLIGNFWIGWKSGLRDTGIGIVFWLVARNVSRLIHFLANSHPVPTRLLPHSTRDLVISVLFAVVAGVAEEFIFRGYLLKQFSALCGNAGAGLLIQASIFTLFHGYHQSLATFAQHFGFGLLAGLLAHWRRSLLPGMIGHAWLDAYPDLLRLARLG